MCTLYGESAATGLGQEEELNCDSVGTLTDMAELSLPMDQSPSPPGSLETRELVPECSSTHSDSLLDSELPSSCIQLRDWCDRMDCSKACAGEFSLLLSLSGDMEDGIFENMSEGEEGGAAEPDSALDSGGSRSGSERVTEEQSSVLVDTASGDVGCCLETSEPLPQPSAAGRFDSVAIHITVTIHVCFLCHENNDIIRIERMKYSRRQNKVYTMIKYYAHTSRSYNVLH